MKTSSKLPLILCLIATAAVFTVGYFTGSRAWHASRGGSIVIEKRDTVTVTDTITIREPVYVEKEVTRTELFAVTDTIRMHDTLYVHVPMESRHYSDSLYDAWVSGYHASLDSISVYPRTVYITTERTIVPQVSKKRWGIGVQAGYGITATSGSLKAAPYIGVGVSYDLVRF